MLVWQKVKCANPNTITNQNTNPVTNTNPNPTNPKLQAHIPGLSNLCRDAMTSRDNAVTALRQRHDAVMATTWWLNDAL